MADAWPPKQIQAWRAGGISRSEANILIDEIERLQARVAELEEKLRPGSPTERAPTTWAYEQACRTIDKHHSRIQRRGELLRECLQFVRECSPADDSRRDDIELAAKIRAELEEEERS